jgi:Zn-dependent protease
MKPMIQPEALKPEIPHRVIGKIFDTPLVVVGNTWLPLTQIVVWGIMSKISAHKNPHQSAAENLTVGGLSVLAMLGSEWCHNLAHAATAKGVGKPMDALRIAWGMPLCVYHQLNDRSVSPRQHVLRALGGPAVNAFILGLVSILRRFTPETSIVRQVADAGVGMNTFLVSASLLPIPGIDGGPVLKWSLVQSGRSIAEADEIVRQVDKVTGVGLGLAAGIALKRKRQFLGAILGMFSAIALAVGFGLYKEE